MRDKNNLEICEACGQIIEEIVHAKDHRGIGAVMCNCESPDCTGWKQRFPRSIPCKCDWDNLDDITREE